MYILLAIIKDSSEVHKMVQYYNKYICSIECLPSKDLKMHYKHYLTELHKNTEDYEHIVID